MRRNSAVAGKPAHWTIGAKGLEETALIDCASPPSGPPLFSALGDIGGFRHEDLTVSPTRGMETNPQMSSIDSLDFAELNPAVVVRGECGNAAKAAHIRSTAARPGSSASAWVGECV